MRTAIYIEDGVIQLVLTPDNEWEKLAIASFEKKNFSTRIFSGAFYDCRGGWVRQGTYYSDFGGYNRTEDRSLILRVEQEPEKSPSPEQP